MFKCLKSNSKAILLGGAAVLALMSAPHLGAFMAGGNLDVVSSALAASDAGAKRQGQGAAQGMGGQSGGGVRGGFGQGTGLGGGMGDGRSLLEDRVFRGSGKRVIIILEEEDSDRPIWAGGNTDLNPHAKGGNKGGDTQKEKGDLYGDLWVLDRDANGAPILYVWTDSDGDGINDTQVASADGFVQPLDADGNPIPLNEEGEIYTNPDGTYVTAPVEVAFDRLNISRTTKGVFDSALTKALDLLSAATTVTLDEAGRLVVDGSTIDSPLENLALYSAYMANIVIPNLPEGFDPASLLGAASSKTGEVTVDTLVYLNTILGVNQVLSDGTIVYYDFSTTDYTRSSIYDPSVTITYYKDTDGNPDTLEKVTETIYDAVFGGTDWVDPTADGGADDFAQAADDARAVIEFIHSVPLVSEI